MAEETSLSEIKRDNTDDDIINLDETADETADEATEETEQIREQIEETRSKMGETIDAIQEKLSLSNITEQVSDQVSEQVSNMYQTAKESIFDATIGKAGEIMNNVNRELKKSNIINKIGENPLPLLLITVGAGLLLFNNKKGSRYSSNYRGGKSFAQTSGARTSGIGSSASSFVSDTKETIGNAASTAYESAGNFASSAYEGVSSAAGGTIEKVGNLGGQAKDQYDHYINENPLAVGAVAFAVGATLGLAIPTTQYENQLAGEARENLVSKVRDTVKESVNDTVDKVKNIADTAKSAIGEEAKNQGLV